VRCRLTGVCAPDWDATESRVAQLKNRPIRREPNLPVHTVLFKFIFSMNTAIDVISVVPYYLAVGLPSWRDGQTNSTASFIRILRGFRVFRGAFLKDGDMPGILQRAMSGSGDAFMIMGLLMVIATVIAGCVLYAAEAGSYRITTDYPKGAHFRWNALIDDYESTPSPFDSIPTCMYMAVITLTTVGYGE
jgi:voltage-gated potassium channel